MESIMNILILVSFILEVFVLVYLEKKIWNTLYTPLNFLILPYTLVLLITVGVAGKMGFVNFYYPSILLWSIGMICFFIPSCFLGIIFNKKYGPPISKVEAFNFNIFLIGLIQLIIFLFVIRFVLLFQSSEFIVGSDDFGEQYCGGGFWGHLRILTSPLLILLIYSVNKQHKIYWIYIFCLLFVNMLYQVKGWVIIPCVAGVALRLYTYKLKLKPSLLFKVFLLGFFIFQLSYSLILVVAGDSEMSWEFIEAVSGHFFHYLTSGTFGLSMDMENFFPDRRTIEIVLAPFFNIYNVFSGNEMVSFLNPLFYNPGLDLTNVRTFFGTLFINTTFFQFILYILVLSCIMYFLRIISVLSHNLIINVIYIFLCSLLSMGWFDFYFISLDIIEVPVFLLILMMLQRLYWKYDNNIFFNSRVR